MTLLFMFLLLLCTETNYWCSCKCYKPWPLSHDNNDSCLKRTMLYVVCKDNTKKNPLSVTYKDPLDFLAPNIFTILPSKGYFFGN